MSAAARVQRRLAPSRESVTTIADDGSRVFLHPADVRGRFTTWRRIVATLLIAVYVLLPWIPVGGGPAVFFDLLDLRLHFFGLTLATQDFWLIFFLITGLGFGLFYVTALFGRIWCGWACPQTVFLEHVYRRIERWLEGDAARRRALDRAPWDAGKWLRRGTKHVLFVLVSLLITHVWLAYFVSLPRLFDMVTHSPLQHWGVFVFILISTAVLYFNFAWFREQLCIIICPYGRLQSTLIDDDSLSIGYDADRGEPRGHVQKTDDRGQTTAGGSMDAAAPSSDRGDCIDCFRCVQVCPTGIDIRQGLQMECIGCAACIDACDDIMTRLGRPRGLVRYDSLNGLAGRATRFLRPRILLYTGLLVLGAGVAGFSALRYAPAEVSAVRMSSSPYVVDDLFVRNQFLVRVTNKQSVPATFTVRVVADATVGANVPAGLTWTGWEEPVEVAADAEERRPLIVVVPRASYRGDFPFHFEVGVHPGDVTLRRSGEFLGPNPQVLSDHVSPAP